MGIPDCVTIFEVGSNHRLVQEWYSKLVTTFIRLLDHSQHPISCFNSGSCVYMKFQFIINNDAQVLLLTAYFQSSSIQYITLLRVCFPKCITLHFTMLNGSCHLSDQGVLNLIAFFHLIVSPHIIYSHLQTIYIYYISPRLAYHWYIWQRVMVQLPSPVGCHW